MELGSARGADYAVGALLVTLTLWLGLSLLVVVDRALHDRRTKLLRRLIAAHDEGGQARIAVALARLSRGDVYRAIADPAALESLRGQCVAYALRRWGLERIRCDALPRGGWRRRKWRRAAALFALGHIRSDDVHEILARAVNDRDADVAAAAVVVLHRLGDERAAEILIDALVRQSFSPSRIATQLDQFPIPIGHLLRPLLSSRSPHARYWSASLLWRYPDATGLSHELAALADDAHPPARKAAIESLAAMNPSTAALVAKRLIRDPVAFVRARAVRAFAAGPSSELNYMRRAARARRVAPMLADPEWDVRLAAKETLVALGASIWREVAPYLDSPDRFARNGAAEVLQNFGLIDRFVQDTAPGTGALDVLERSFREGGPGVVAAAIARANEPPVPEVASLLERFGFVGVKPA